MTDGIDNLHPRDGIRLASGRELAADVVVTATGLDLLFLGGMELAVDGERVDPAQSVVYRGMMLSGIPNFAFALGYTNASWTLKVDLVTEHVCRLLDLMDRRGHRVVRPGSPPIRSGGRSSTWTPGTCGGPRDGFRSRGSRARGACGRTTPRTAGR